MASKRMGLQTVAFRQAPVIVSGASIVGKIEGDGPLAKYFDMIIPDDLWGEKSWEKTERKMFKTAVSKATEKAGVKPQDINYLLGGDLLNQIISASFAARELALPFYGQYGACSTMSQSLSLGAMLIDGGFAENVACAASSHFATAERQYRYPLEFGCQRPLSAQRTVTGAGCSILAKKGDGPRITYATTGKVVDWGIKDANNMGACMAPACADSIAAHMRESDRTPDYYDVILTGDLGNTGSTILKDLTKRLGYDICNNHIDCGSEIFSTDQDAHSGGSGCGCSAVVFNSCVLERLVSKEYKKVLFLATGALLSPTTMLQGDSIPGIAHAVAIEM